MLKYMTRSICALCLAVTFISPLGAESPQKRPNVILISIDTMRADVLGCYSGGPSVTPNIDRFANESVLFENAITVSPWTLPAHMSMFTGLYPSKHRLNYPKTSPFFWQKPTPLHREIRTLGEIFRSRGYSAAAFTGGGYVKGAWGFGRGFDVYDDKKLKIDKGVSAAIDWLNKKDDSPFFLFLHTYTMHAPYLGHKLLNSELKLISDEKYDEFVEEYHQLDKLNDCQTKDCRLTEEKISDLWKLYQEAARVVDLEFSRFISFLNAEGLAENTLVILTSDHGEEFYEHQALLHGHTLYSEQLNIPLIVHWPRHMKPGARIKTLVSNIDIFPFLCDIADAEHHSDGRSLIDIINGKTVKDLADRKVFSESTLFTQQKSLTTKTHKIILNTRWYFSFWPWKPNNQRWQFYDNNADPQEKENISSQRGEAFKGLRSGLIQQMKNNKKNRRERSKENQLSDKKLIEDLRSLGYMQ